MRDPASSRQTHFGGKDPIAQELHKHRVPGLSGTSEMPGDTSASWVLQPKAMLSRPRGALW